MWLFTGTLESPPIAIGPLREEEMPWTDFTVMERLTRVEMESAVSNLTAVNLW